jgi:hypothetical protein
MKAERVKGHELCREGAAHFSGEHEYTTREGTWGRGCCSCGQMSEMLPSTAARKRWHREHKRRIQAERSTSK